MAITRLGGANAITGTLPAANINDTSIGNITALPAGVGGKIGQVSQTLNTYDQTINSQSLTDILSASGTAFEVSMTPSATSSKILFMCNLFVGALNNSQAENRYRLTINAKIGSGSYSEIENYTYMGQYNYTGSNPILMNQSPYPFSFLYSPSTTSAVTFKLQILNYNASSSLSLQNDSKPSQVNLFEVLA